MTRKTVIAALLAAMVAAISLGGCKTAGSAVQGVGNVFNKTGSTIKGLGS